MFVDSNIGLSGIDFVESLNTSAKGIFTTAYREHAFDGFKVDATDKHVKQISFVI